MNRAKWHERLETHEGRRLPAGFLAAGAMGLLAMGAIAGAFWFLVLAG